MGEILDFQTASKIERENRKKQKASKYSDRQIQIHISNARNTPPEFTQAEALTALAMIAYNRMIDERWK